MYMKKTQEQLNKRREIIRTALGLFRKSSFYQVSVNEIVKRSNSSIAAFYRYFSAKEDLVCTYRNDVMQRCTGFFQTLMQSELYENMNGNQKLQVFLLHLANRMSRVGAEFNCVFALRRVLEHDVAPGDKSYLPLIAQLLLLGQQDGSIRQDYSPEQLLQLTDRLLTGGFLFWAVHYGDQRMENVCQKPLALFCESLQPGHGGGPVGDFGIPELPFLKNAVGETPSPVSRYPLNPGPNPAADPHQLSQTGITQPPIPLC